MMKANEKTFPPGQLKVVLSLINLNKKKIIKCDGLSCAEKKSGGRKVLHRKPIYFQSTTFLVENNL